MKRSQHHKVREMPRQRTYDDKDITQIYQGI